MSYTNQLSNSGSYKYVVTGSLPGPFHTIQNAINQAVTDGGNTTILVRPGTYNENLTLFAGVNIEGTEDQVIINGIHTPPAAGVITISNCFLSSATHILSSAVAGTTAIRFVSCVFDCTNGYIFNLTNWTGPLLITGSFDQSTSNGIMTNSAGADLEIINSQVGINGVLGVTGASDIKLFNADIEVDILAGGAATVAMDGGTSMQGALILGGTASSTIYNSRITTLGGVSCITTTSATIPSVTVANVTLDTSAGDAIAGVGTIELGEVVFLDSDGIAVTVLKNGASSVGVQRIFAEDNIELVAGTFTISGSNGTNGQLPIAATAGNLAWASLTSTSGTVAFTPGANSLSIDVIEGGINWQEATASMNLVANNGYITKIAVPGLLTYTLPATAAQGTIIEITGYTVGLWTIAQLANQQIHFGDADTTLGVAGSLTATKRYDSIRLVCVTANLEWNVLSAVGNITIA